MTLCPPADLIGRAACEAIPAVGRLGCCPSRLSRFLVGTLIATKHLIAFGSQGRRWRR